MDLIVEGRGVFVGKHQGRLRVTQEGKVLSEAPLIHLEHVLIVDAGVAVSSDVVRVCAEEGIPIHFVSSTGRAIAGLYSAGLTGTVLTRRAQLGAYNGPRGLALAIALVRGKLENQANLLRYIGKYRKTTDEPLYEELTLVVAEVRDHLAELAALPSGTVEERREQLLSVEGRAAQRYWSAIAQVIPSDLAWPGRETQGARDPFNIALNYGYGILYAQVEQALILAGLDPYGGFLHADRPGKPSLVLDVIEPFRQTVVDRTVIGLVNKGFELARDELGLLDKGTRHRLAEKILERLESTDLFEGKRQPLRIILQTQARQVATFLRGDREEFKAFVAPW
jgi:CRISPR-associated protein Cas1